MKSFYLSEQWTGLIFGIEAKHLAFTLKNIFQWIYNIKTNVTQKQHK